MATGHQGMGTTSPRSGNSDSERGGGCPRSHSGGARVWESRLPPSASGANFLLHRGLPDARAGGQSLHQVQGTFLRDAVVTQTRREMRLGMGWGQDLRGALPSPPAPPAVISGEERPQCLSVHSPDGDAEAQNEARRGHHAGRTGPSPSPPSCTHCVGRPCGPAPCGSGTPRA